jgi:6-pyruvoyltetrahydropterin/6-carboxytetrahydropterin synthase
MYKVKIKLHIDSAHYLPNYKGKCKQFHGHRWDIIFIFNYAEADLVDGMAVDFKKLKSDLNEYLDKLDHRCLNDFIPNPTAENISKIIYCEVKEKLYKSLTSVKVFETPGCEVEYVEN